MKHRLMIDADDSLWLVKSDDPLWTSSEIIEIEAKRLRNLFPKLGYLATIFRTDNGWHLRFNRYSLEFEELEAALCESKIEHNGHRILSSMLGEAVHRVTRKPRGNSEPPRVFKVIQFE